MITKRLRVRIVSLLTLTLAMRNSHASSLYTIDPTTPALSSTAQRALQTALDNAEHKIPPFMRQQIKGPIHIKPSPLPKDVLGLVKPQPNVQLIQVSQTLFTNPIDQEKLLKTIVHESAHVSDFQANQKYSSDPALKELGEFRGWGGHSQQNTRANEASSREGRDRDPWAYSSSREFLAVNFEAFALDPNFACRAPIVFEHYRQIFNYDPYPARTCKVNYKIPVYDGDPTAVELVDLDPKHIYQIHYGNSSPGKSPLSKLGHAMYHLVICGPEHPVPGPDCLLDTPYHLIMNYVVDPADGSKAQTWKSMTGKYPSHLAPETFNDKMKDYNVKQLRSVESNPLVIDEVTKTRLIQRMLEQYWGYEGRYRYASTNCATEAQKTFNIALQGSGQEIKVRRSPVGGRNELARDKFLDQKSKSPTATEDGYYYPSAKPGFEKTLALLRTRNAADPKLRSLHAFTSATATQRRNLCEQAYRNFPPQGEARTLIAVGCYDLENYVLIQTQDKFMSKINESELLKKDKACATPLCQANRRLRQITVQLSPQQLAVGGYGIPLESELNLPDAHQLELLRNESVANLKTLLDNGAHILPAESVELAGIQNNISAFSEMIAPSDNSPAESAPTHAE